MSKIRVLPMKRRREYKTNYYKRLKLLKGRKPRLVVRGFSKSILGQIVEYAPKGDRVIGGVNSLKLKTLGWGYNCSNLPASYLTGLLLGKFALSKGIKEVLFDVGPHPIVKGSRLFALAKGVIDAGLGMPVAKEMFPTEDRISGKHISSHSPKSKIEIDFKKLKEKILGAK